MDVIKGFLVIIMLFYHCASIGDFASLQIIMRKLDFIHYAFLAVAGFLCGYHYYPVTDSTKRRVRMRLLTRSGKILLLFVFANIAFCVLDPGHANIYDSLRGIKISALVEYFVFCIPEEAAFEIFYLFSVFLCVAAMIIGCRRAKIMLCVPR